MAVEHSANNISQLNQNFPTAEDFVSEGDDHIRLIKKTLKNTFPRVKDVCVVSHQQLTTLGSAVKDSISEEEVLLYNDIKLKKSGFVESKTASRQSEINQNTLLTLGSMINLVYPVGALYLSTVNTNPAELFGVGTWEPYAQGRTLVGVGTLSAKSIAGGQEFGSQNVTITEANLPPHQHGVTGVTVGRHEGHTHGTTFDATRDNGDNDGGEHYLRPKGQGGRDHIKTTYQSDNGGAHTHVLSGKVDVTGQGTPVDNHQPSIGTYIWKRIR